MDYKNNIKEKILGIALIAPASFDVNENLHNTLQKFKYEIESNLLQKDFDTIKYLRGMLHAIDLRINLLNEFPEKKYSFNPKVRVFSLMKFYNAVGGYLDDECLYILNSKQVQVKLSGLTVHEVALMYAYLSDIDFCYSINSSNKDQIAAKYGFKSGDYLKNIFLKYTKRKDRLFVNSENKRSASEHLSRLYRIQAPLLKISKEAHQLVVEDYSTFNKKFDRYF